MKRRRFVLILAAAVLCALGALYYRLAVWPLGSVSEFETVNDAYWLDEIEMTLEKETYPADTKEITLRVKNHSEDKTLRLSSHDRHCNWFLEKKINGIWRTQRTVYKNDTPMWSLSPRNGDLNSLGPSGVIQWGGEEDSFTFNIEWFYGSPMEPGSYRIVIPSCEMSYDRIGGHDLAVEFEVN